MLTILHGENTVQSRNALVSLMDQTKEKSIRVERIETKSLELAQLQERLASQSLFGEQTTLVLEEIHSLPKSARKDALITLLQEPSTANHETIAVIMWEKRALTATMLKKFVGAQVQEFKITNTLFKWLDSLTGQPANKTNILTGLRAAIDSDGEFMCHSMLARQTRMLLQAQEGSFGGMAPFMIGKLQKQASTFTEAQLKNIHHRLLEIDRAEKTSSSPLSLAEQLELLVIEM